MKAKLVLSLTSAHLGVEVLPRTCGSGIFSSLSHLGKARSHAKFEFSAVISQGGLRSRLDQAIAQLKASHGAALPGLDLEVQLGLDQAHIGVMVLDDAATTDLSTSRWETYVHAWVRQMLHMDPQQHVIRWQVLANANKLLVSCVDRRVFDELHDFALENGLRFLSCRPAILSAMPERGGEPAGAASTPDHGVIVVWTEAGTNASRSNSVQLLRFRGKQISSAWRGWVPLLAESQGADWALEGAVRRFQARHSAQGDPVQLVHWPR